MSEPYKYCYTCGDKLIVHTRIWSYDGETGEPSITYDYACSNRRLFVRHPRTSGEAYAMEAF